MVKSARRRNAKKTIGRNKGGTKGYRRKTMRKRQKGGVRPSAAAKFFTPIDDQRPTRVMSAPTFLADSDTESEHSFTSPPESSTRSVKHNQQTEEVKYTITKKGDSWLVTIFIDGTKETYVVPDDILGKVGRRRETAVG